MTDPCRFGQHCRDRYAGQPAQIDGRGLCWPCERHGRHAISRLPGQWVALGAMLGRDIAATTLGTRASASAEASLLIHEGIDALRGEILHALTTWEWPVREAARLSDPPDRSRDRTALNRAATILVEHYPVLLALQPTATRLYAPPDTEVVGVTGAGKLIVADLDGPDAVTYLAGLHHRADRVLGNVTAREPRTGPCQAPDYGGCGLAELAGRPVLSYTVGDTCVRCRNCGWSLTLDQYRWYALNLIPPGYRPATVGAL